MGKRPGSNLGGGHDRGRRGLRPKMIQQRRFSGVTNVTTIEDPVTDAIMYKREGDPRVWDDAKNK